VPTVAVTLITKPGCHLCEDARGVVDGVLAELAGEPGAPIALDEVNMLEDEALVEEYGEEIPVVLIDGRMHTYWHVDAERFRTALRTRREALA
jgi:hypothetical protein